MRSFLLLTRADVHFAMRSPRVMVSGFAATLLIGCASPNVNPSAAKAHTGYVDFYDPEGHALSWDIGNASHQEDLYTEYEPKTGIVRLAFAPGRYQLEIAVLNKIITGPVTNEIQVFDGQITPLQVRLVEEGSTLLDRRQNQSGGTSYGHYGRRSTVTRTETKTFRLQTDALDPIAYSPKERTPYASPAKPRT